MREKQPHLTHRVRRTLERASRKFGVSTAALARMRERHHAKLKAQEIDVGHGNGRPGSAFATEKDKKGQKKTKAFLLAFKGSVAVNGADLNQFRLGTSICGAHEGQASQNWPLKSTPHRCSREEGEKKCVFAFLAAWVCRREFG
jgi:hypothetical protein